MNNKLYLSIICLLTIIGNVFGQESHGGKPITFGKSFCENHLNKVKGISQINTNQLPVIDNTYEILEAEKYLLQWENKRV